MSFNKNMYTTPMPPTEDQKWLVPGLTDHLGGVPIIETIERKEYRKIYLNSYSEGSPHWRTMLYQVSQANVAVLLMKYLFLRAKDVLQSNTGIGTRRITREDFVRKLCMFLQLSTYRELRRTMGYVTLSGVWRFW